MRPTTLALALVLATWSGWARAAPRLVSFTCQIGEARTRILPSLAREERADEELHCRASLRDLGGRSPLDLVAELRLLPPTGPFRVVASRPLSPVEGRADAALLQEMFVPASTWVSGVDWRARGGPRVRLVLRILDKPSRGHKRWRVVATRSLELRG